MEEAWLNQKICRQPLPSVWGGVSRENRVQPTKPFMEKPSCHVSYGITTGHTSEALVRTFADYPEQSLGCWCMSTCAWN